MAQVVLQMPRTTLTMDTGRILRWLKDAGDAVAEGEAVAEVETDKTVVEVQAPIAGYLRQVLAETEVDVPVTAPIAVFTASADEPLAAADAAAGNSPASSAAPAAAAAHAKERAVARSESEGDRVVRASPAVRIRARAEGVDLSGVAGSGPRGRILLRDYELRGQPREAAAPPAQAVIPDAGLSPQGDRMRAAIAAAMLKSWREQPQFTITREVDMGHVLQLRTALAAAAPDVKLSVADFLIQAFARALPAHQSLNVRTDQSGLGHPSATVDMGVAVAVADGLVVPVVRGADRLTLPQIASQRALLTQRSLAGRLGQDDLGGATFTLSNLGPFGVDEFNAIVSPGEAAIVAVGAVRERPVAVDGQVVVRPTLRMTLTVDHRLADGSAGARLLADVVERIEGRLGWILF